MKTTNRFPTIDIKLPDPPAAAFEAAQNSASSIERQLRNFVLDLYERSSTQKISSLVDKYKGPDSIDLPQRSSRVEQYQGPDSLKRPEIESEVEKYKGPRSLFDERGSRVEKYKGPDSAERQIFILPERTADIIESIQNARSSLLGLKNFYENK